MPIRCRSMTGLELVNEGETVKPIADPRGREKEPDDAALDELRKAFGVVPDKPVAHASEQADDPGAALDATGAATFRPNDAPTQAADEPQTHETRTDAPPVPPVDVPTAEPPKPAQQRIVRIDDYAASHAAPPPTAGAPAPPVDPLIAHPPKPAAAREPSVISIEADDLPDAVYVEGSLDGGGPGSIVFIEDDVAADALTPESDRDLRRGIEPRMRERRLAVKRAHGRKRLRWLIALLGRSNSAAISACRFVLASSSTSGVSIHASSLTPTRSNVSARMICRSGTLRR